jgi:hypothetical protein
MESPVYWKQQELLGEKSYPATTPDTKIVFQRDMRSSR